MTRVVFDVGNVLLDWDPRAVYRNDFASDAEIDAFLDEIGFHAWNVEQDRGRSWDEAVVEKSAEHPHHAELIAKFHADWHDSVPGAIADSVAALEQLRAAGYALYAITNFSAEKWDECRARFDFLNGFRDVVVSARVRLIKPDPAIFRLFLDRNGLEAGDCLFIDDSAANIATARAMGFDTLHFTEPGSLTASLRGRGLLP